MPQSSSHLRVDGVSASFGDRRVLTDVTFTVSSGDRVGLIGENGAGKSTLLRVIVGDVEPSSGTVWVSPPAGGGPAAGLLRQEPPFSAADTVDDAVEAAVVRLRRTVMQVVEQSEALTGNPNDTALLDEYSAALDEAERLDAWNIDGRIDAVLAGLGLGGVGRERNTGSLSGGQRARLALAVLLLSGPEVLLLDEPTNHLDASAIAYLTGVLNGWRGPVVVASHDRAFLDEAVTSIIDLDPTPLPHSVSGPLVQDGAGTGIGVTRFTGGYSDYLRARSEARERWERRYRDEQAEIARLRAGVDDHHTVGHSDWRPRTETRAARKFYADRNAKVVSRRVNDARTRLTAMERDQVRRPPAELEFSGLTAGGVVRTGPREPVLTATDVAVDGRLAPMSLSVSRGEKWLITGPNGAGKSTLLNVLAGTVTPTSGTVARSLRDRIGILSQDVDSSVADPDGERRTAREIYAGQVGAERADTVPLSTFGLLAGRDLDRPVGDLSVGQQRRLALAILLADPPEILLLDEPSNHLSLGLVTAVEEALAGYPGTVLIASHDRWLTRTWRGPRLELDPVDPESQRPTPAMPPYGNQGPAHQHSPNAVARTRRDASSTDRR
ncbi:MAG: ABC-F family ATP-binding cassette domain-containing protein [Gordonia sp. (in: high G+C Gram-positive bacteria)]|uniref:ABC-F family ATP-binding cassette domain-containing protein n=1 Tax=Gordonia sp. (in: high G+C Gram-positive bacteria) TaxID=84139 RepID=UPI0039E2F612